MCKVVPNASNELQLRQVLDEAVGHHRCVLSLWMAADSGVPPYGADMVHIDMENGLRTHSGSVSGSPHGPEKRDVTERTTERPPCVEALCRKGPK